MDEYLQTNRKLWDQWTTEHEKSPFYDLAGFKAGKDRLRSIELEELGNISGKTLLHLQCHFGIDTLAWARRGAIVTGVDFSEQSIALARSLSQELNIPAQFHCSEIDTLPSVLSGEFDIVFTSYGVLHWLRDLRRWGEVIAHFLKPGGIFYIVEDHPFMRVFNAGSETELQVAGPYFSDLPEKVEMVGSYATEGKGETVSFYMWNHSLGEVINALIAAGLQIEFLHEFPVAARAKFPCMEQGDDNWWRLTRQHNMIPLLFSLQARKVR
jgi:SAM-dependent methyltransferase